MLSLEQLVAFSLVALVMIVVPGPSVVFAVGRALAHGGRRDVRRTSAPWAASR